MTQTRGEGIGHSVAVCPINVRSPDIAIFDDEGNEKTDLAEVLSSNDILDTNHASINVAHSNDVMVGPSTQFYGPVTINHNVYGPLNRPDNSNQNTTTPTIQTPPSTPPQQQQQQQPQQRPESTFSSKENLVRKLALKYVIYAVLGVAIAIFLTLVIVFSTGNTKAEPSTPKPDPDDDSGIDYNKKWFLDRKYWNARPRKNNTRPLRPPVDYVIISHTVSPMCYTYRDCSQRVLNIQSQHMNNNSPDIGYNFLIGADNHVYEGRGWDIRNFHTDNSIGICLIGDFTIQEPTSDMIKSLQRLLELGVSINKLSKDYILVGHNQTFKTESPGQNVIKIISKWPHFNPDTRL